MITMPIIIYDLTTGEITSTKSVNPSEVANNVPPGRGVLFGTANYETQMVDLTTGKVRDKQ